MTSNNTLPAVFKNMAYMLRCNIGFVTSAFSSASMEEELEDGVKRIMPLIISNPEGVSLELESNLVNGKTKKSVGKLKNYINNFGIGIMRIEDCLTAQNNEETIIFSDDSNISVKVLKPDWWPETSINRLREK